MMRTQVHATVAVVLMFVVAAAAGAAVEVRLRERVVLKASVVRLADVAEVVAADSGDSPKISNLPLTPAPAPGTRRFLQQRELIDLLTAHGMDPRDVRFGGASQVEIVAEGDAWKTSRLAASAAPSPRLNRHAAILAGQQLTEPSMLAVDTTRAEALRSELNRLIADYLAASVPQAATWRVSCQLEERHLALLESSTAPVCQGGSPPWTGRQRFVVSFSTPEGAVQLPVYAEVAATSTPVVVASRPVARGEPITAADLELKSVNYLPKADARRAAVESIEELIGMEARQAIRAGEVVFTDQVQAPLLVKRGEVISVSSQAGGIRVRTTARARENAARGELVQVESLDTRERFMARVVGPREAAIFAPTRLETAHRSSEYRVARPERAW
jgi:flagella basal body P-ring formation protein FlgA